jgi:hypothetical protein
LKGLRSVLHFRLFEICFFIFFFQARLHAVE